MPESFDTVPVWMMLVGFLLMLGPLVTLHELGHYLVARWCGVDSKVFSVGFGNELAGFTDRRGTRWRLSSIPLGGYVQFKGDMSPASAADPNLSPEDAAGAFQTAPLWQRALIVAAGPVMNLAIAVLIFAGFALTYGIPTTPAVVQSIVDGSPAEVAGLQLEDRIIAVDGSAVDNLQDLQELIVPYPGQPVELTIERGDQVRRIDLTIGDVTVTDRFGNASRIGQLGVGSYDRTLNQVGPFSAMGFGVDASVGMMGMMATGIRQIVVGERTVDELGGPITMGRLAGQRLSLGPLPFIEFIAFISINLAFINLLPIPTLDGGHLAFYAAEAVRRKPASARSQEWAFRTGMAFVLALMLFVTILDVAKLPMFGS